MALALRAALLKGERRSFAMNGALRGSLGPVSSLPGWTKLGSAALRRTIRVRNALPRHEEQRGRVDGDTRLQAECSSQPPPVVRREEQPLTTIVRSRRSERMMRFTDSRCASTR